MMPRRFVLFFFGLTLGGFWAVIALNAVVDPSRLLRDPRPDPGPSHAPPQRLTEHVTVAHRLRIANSVGTLIFGSSTARNLLPLVDRRIRDDPWARQFFPDQPVFNAALGGASIHVAARVLDHTLSLHHPREAVYVLNFDGLNSRRATSPTFLAANYNGGRTVKDWAKLLSLLWNPSMALDSATAVATGFGGGTGGPAPIARSGQDKWATRIGEFLQPGYYGGMMIGDREWLALSGMLHKLRERHIKTTVIASPIHPLQMEILIASGNLDNYKTHLERLERYCSDTGAELFAFDIYDELLSDSYFDSSRTAPLEKYTGKDAAPHFFDGVHFNWPIGVEMLKFIKLGTGSLAAGAGRRLNSPAEVAAFFDRLTARRVAYLAAHPDIAPILKSARQRAFDGDDQAAP